MLDFVIRHYCTCFLKESKGKQMNKHCLPYILLFFNNTYFLITFLTRNIATVNPKIIRIADSGPVGGVTPIQSSPTQGAGCDESPSVNLQRYVTSVHSFLPSLSTGLSKKR